MADVHTLRGSLEFGGMDLDEPNAIARFLANGGDPNLRTYSGDPLLRAVVNRAKPGDVALLLLFGADPNAEGSKSFRPIHGVAGAASGTDPELSIIIDLLVRYGADIEAKNHLGHTALTGASIFGQPLVVDALLKHGADPESKATDGTSALDFAKKGCQYPGTDNTNHYRCVEILERAALKKIDRARQKHDISVGL